MPAVNSRPATRPANCCIAGMQRLYAASAGRSLDDSGFRVRFHHAHQRGYRLPGHHAVGIEHHHVAVIASPAAAEVRHVTSLAAGAALAQPVIESAAIAQLFTQSRPGGQLLQTQIRVIGIGKHIDIEQVWQLRSWPAIHKSHAIPQTRSHRLIADRHDDGGACVMIQGLAAGHIDGQCMRSGRHSTHNPISAVTKPAVTQPSNRPNNTS